MCHTGYVKPLPSKTCMLEKSAPPTPTISTESGRAEARMISFTVASLSEHTPQTKWIKLLRSHLTRVRCESEGPTCR